jgi:hypothetical protein
MQCCDAKCPAQSERGPWRATDSAAFTRLGRMTELVALSGCGLAPPARTLDWSFLGNASFAAVLGRATATPRPQAAHASCGADDFKCGESFDKQYRECKASASGPGENQVLLDWYVYRCAVWGHDEATKRARRRERSRTNCNHASAKPGSAGPRKARFIRRLP